jgi:hypothetical protein
MVRREGGHQGAPRGVPPREGPPDPPRGPLGPTETPPGPPRGPPRTPPGPFFTLECLELGARCRVGPGDPPGGAPQGQLRDPVPQLGARPREATRG